MKPTIVVMKDGRQFEGPLWEFRPKEGWFSISDNDAPNPIRFSEVQSAVTRRVQVQFDLITDVDLLERAKNEGWDGK